MKPTIYDGSQWVAKAALTCIDLMHLCLDGTLFVSLHNNHYTLLIGICGRGKGLYNTGNIIIFVIAKLITEKAPQMSL